MTTGPSDPLPRLADALSDVAVRLREISTELRDLRPGTTTTFAPQPVRRAPKPPPVPPPPPPAVPPPAFPSWTPAEPVARPTLWERLSRDGAGSRILAWAGGVVTLAGVVLLLVLAIQRGYLGPLPRVLIGAGLGAVLIGIGLRLHRNPNARTGAYALAATGIAVLYLDVIAATALYAFLPPFAGLLAGLAVAGTGIALAGLWDSQLLAVFVVVCCAVSAPIPTEGFGPLLLGFLLVLEIATTPVQLARRWGGLCLAAGLPAVLATLISIGLSNAGGFGVEPASTAVLCLVTSAVQVALSTISAVRRPDDLPLVLLLLAPAPTMLAALVVPRMAATALPATIAVLLIMVWVLHRAGMLAVPQRFAMAAGGAGALAVFQATATGLAGDARVLTLLGEALLLALVAVRLRYPAALATSALFGLTGLMLTIAVVLPLRSLVVPPVKAVPLGAAVAAGLTGLLLAALAITMCWAAARLERLERPERARHAWLWAGVVALYGASGMLLSVGLAISPDRAGFLLGHVLVTVSWTVGALALLLHAIDSMPQRVAGLSLAGAALVKLVLFDLSSLDGIARVAAFLVAGLVLLAAGARYARLVATRARPALRDSGEK